MVAPAGRNRLLVARTSMCGWTISVACDTMEFEFHSPLASVGVVHSTWLSMAKWHMHAPTFNKWHKEKNKNKVQPTHEETIMNGNELEE